MLAKGMIPNLVGGISQQDPVLRLANQSADEINTFPVIVDGNKKRPPTEHVAVIGATSTAAFSHFITRDKDEQYCMFISGGAIGVRALDGTTRTVSTPSGTGYIASAMGVDDAKNFDALTIADYTLIVNKSVTTAMNGGVTEPVRTPEALINVLAGNYGKTYSITVNGTMHASVTTPDGSDVTDSKWIDTVVIARQLVQAATGVTVDGTTGGSTFGGSGGTTSGIVGTLTTANGWDVVQIGNAVWIRHLTGVDFTIEVTDGYNGNAMKCVKTETQYFTDLPAYGPNGFVVAIKGSTDTDAGDYYVKFFATGGADGQGVWKECPKPGSVLAFSASTMPHKLVRNSDGTFTFDVITWDQMVAGDEITSPQPSFVGKTISSVTFFQNRIGFLAGQNSIQSRAGDFFNFWRSSAVTLLDTDPIDISAASQKVAQLRSATIFQQQLIVWSDYEQFSYGGNDLLTPKTVHMQEVTPFENLSRDVKPVETPHRVLFCADRNSYTAVREWYTDIYYHIGLADEATAHTPTLIPSGAYKLAVTNTEDIAVVLSSSDRTSAYIYKYFWSGQDKLQSAWTRWQFGNGAILNAGFVNSTLYLVINRNGQTCLEKMRVNPMLTDNGTSAILLDRRVVGLSGSFNATTQQTTYTLPYTISSGATVQAASQSFVLAPVVSATGSTVVMDGDQTATTWYFGERYTMTYKLSPLFVRQAGPDGKTSAVQEGRLQVLKIAFAYSNAVNFRVEVTAPGRRKRTYTYDNLFLDDAAPDVNSVIPKDGVFTVPIKSRGDYVDVQVINDSPFPANFTRAEWSGNFVPKVRK